MPGAWATIDGQVCSENKENIVFCTCFLASSYYKTKDVCIQGNTSETYFGVSLIE